MSESKGNTVQPVFNSEPERFRHTKIVNLVQQYTAPKSKGLDIGCGQGKLVTLLNLKEYDVFGVDSRVSVDCDDRIILGSAEDLPFDTRQFDFIILSNVLAHFEDLDRAMEEIKRVLKPAGFVFVLQSNRIGWRRIMSYHIRKSDRAYHLRAFTKWELWNLLASYNLCPVKFKTAFWFYWQSKLSDTFMRLDRRISDNPPSHTFAPYFDVVAKNVKECDKKHVPGKLKFSFMFIFGTLLSFLLHAILLALEFRNSRLRAVHVT